MTTLPTCLRLTGCTRRTAMFLGALLFAGPFALSAFTASPALANYYAAKNIVHSDPTATHVYALVKTGDCQDIGSNGHINDTIWISTNNSTNWSSWVEIGYTRGWYGSNILTFYWTDVRPGSQEYDHRLTDSISVGSVYKLGLKANSSTSWGVYIDGTQRGTSTPNPDDDQQGIMQTGIETTDINSALGTSSVPVTDYALDYAVGGAWQGRWGYSGDFTNNITGHGHASWSTAGIDLDCYYNQ